MNTHLPVLSACALLADNEFPPPRRRNARPKDWEAAAGADEAAGQAGGSPKEKPGARRRQAVWEQNDALAASIAKAWLAVPADARSRAWPEWGGPRQGGAAGGEDGVAQQRRAAEETVTSILD